MLSFDFKVNPKVSSGSNVEINGKKYIVLSCVDLEFFGVCKGWRVYVSNY